MRRKPALLLIFAVLGAFRPTYSAAGMEPRPVETLLQQVRSAKSSKGAKAIRKAFEALQKSKFTEARKLASPYLESADFGDWAQWIHARSSIAEASAQCEEKAWESCGSNAKKAQKNLERIDSLNPYSPFLVSRWFARDDADSLAVLARSYAGRSKWAQADQAFQASFQKLSNASLLAWTLPQNIRLFGKSCQKSKSPTCEAWIRRLLPLFPKNSEEYKALATSYPPIIDPPRPPGNGANRVTQAYKLPDADTSAFEQAMALYLEDRMKDANAAFEKLLDDFPRSTHRFRARYWLARTSNRLKRADREKNELLTLQADTPLSYYGLLASLQSGKPITSSFQGTVPLAVDEESRLFPHEITRIRRARDWLAAKAPGLAAIELRDIRPRDAMSSLYLVYLAALQSEAGNFALSFQFLGELGHRGYDGLYSSYCQHMIFPVSQSDLIKKSAAENSVDPVLLFSLIKQESGFDANASSGVGAAGLMQIMHSTAIELKPELVRRELIDPEQNIRLGARYLKQLLTKYNGNIVLALAAYNAGPAAASRWFREMRPKAGMLEFIETIPYRETREYVSSIIRNYYWYSRILTPDTPFALNYFWKPYGPPEKPKGVPTITEPAVAMSPTPVAPSVATQPEPGASASPASSATPLSSALPTAPLMGPPEPESSTTPPDEPTPVTE